MYGKLLIALLMLSATALFVAELTQQVTPRSDMAPRGFTNGFATTTITSTTRTASDYGHTTPMPHSLRETPRGDTYNSRIVATRPETYPDEKTIEDLFATLIAPTRPKATTTESTNPELLWDGNRTAPSATPSESEKELLTPYQEALYVYGNTVGEMLSTFELAHSGQATILGDFFSGKGTLTSERVARLADAYTTLSEDLKHVPPPQSAHIIHEKLQNAYASVGRTLATLSSHTTTPTADDVLAYNATAEAVAKQLLALTLLFSSSGVTFSPSDPGSVFTKPDFSSL